MLSLAKRFKFNSKIASMKKTSLKAFPETKLAKLQTLQTGNDCAVHSIVAAIELLTEVKLDPAEIIAEINHCPRLSLAEIRRQAADLARDGADVIDLYVLHRDNPELPVGPIVEILNEHQRAGKIRQFGGSNWTTERIGEANQYVTVLLVDDRCFPQPAGDLTVGRRARCRRSPPPG